MNWVDPGTVSPIDFKTMAVMDQDGRATWMVEPVHHCALGVATNRAHGEDALYGFLRARAVRCTVSGPYFYKFRLTQDDGTAVANTVWMEAVFKPVHFVHFDDDADFVRYDRALRETFGAPARLEMVRMVDETSSTWVRMDMLRHIEQACGGLPGRH